MTDLAIRVLLIEDDEDDYVLTRDLLRSLPDRAYHLDWEFDSEAGLRAMLRNQHDVYLVDYRLGSRNGLDLVREATQSGCCAGPIILLTGIGDREVDVQALSAGAADYLIKGKTDSQLLDRSIRYAIERRSTLRALQAQKEELARSNAELEQFASVVSHDLRGPMHVIGGYVELLGLRYQDRLDEDGQRLIRRALGAVSRLESLVEDLYSYARLASDRQSFRDVPLNDVFQTAIEGLQAEIRESSAVILRDDLPVVPGNPIQLDQLFRNLFGNAIKFRDNRPPRIYLRARPDPIGWRLQVEDNGIGIARSDCERIFKMFQRLHAGAEYNGTGIGLAICKKVVERHGGEIWVESQPGVGSTFSLTLSSERREPAAGSPLR
jgi:signal transduction histidine kinase